MSSDQASSSALPPLSGFQAKHHAVPAVTTLHFNNSPCPHGATASRRRSGETQSIRVPTTWVSAATYRPRRLLHGTANTPQAESDSEEHYSDAHSGPGSPTRASPVPKTRVERIDDKPAYGEVPGTQAYRMREEDAAPDEIAIITDPKNLSKSDSDQPARSPTPGGHPIPKTVVEETPDAEGSVTHPENRQRRKSDAHPDVIVKADGQKVEDGGEATGTDA